MQEKGKKALFTRQSRSNGDWQLEVLRDTGTLLWIMRRVLDAGIPPGSDIANNRLSTAQLRWCLMIRHRASLRVRVPVRGILFVEARWAAPVRDADAAFSRSVRARYGAVRRRRV